MAAAAGKERDVFGFEKSERSIEQFPPRHDDDVEAAYDCAPPEQLAGASLCPVALDG